MNLVRSLKRYLSTGSVVPWFVEDLGHVFGGGVQFGPPSYKKMQFHIIFWTIIINNKSLPVYYRTYFYNKSPMRSTGREETSPFYNERENPDMKLILYLLWLTPPTTTRVTKPCVLCGQTPKSPKLLTRSPWRYGKWRLGSITVVTMEGTLTWRRLWALSSDDTTCHHSSVLFVLLSLSLTILHPAPGVSADDG